MAFVRYNVVKGRKYYNYVRNYREEGRHRQEVLCYLDPYESLEEAIKDNHELMVEWLTEAAFWKEEADSTGGYLLEFYGDELGGEIPSCDEASARWALFEEECYDNRCVRRDVFRCYPPANRTAEEWEAEWEAEWERWEARKRVEQELHDLILDYHDTKREAELARKHAERARAERDKFIAVKQKYS